VDQGLPCREPSHHRARFLSLVSLLEKVNVSNPKFIEPWKYWLAWALVKLCHLRCQAFTRPHADTLGYTPCKYNYYSGAVWNLWGLETKLRLDLETVDRKQAQVNDPTFRMAVAVSASSKPHLLEAVQIISTRVIEKISYYLVSNITTRNLIQLYLKSNKVGQDPQTIPYQNISDLDQTNRNSIILFSI